MDMREELLKALIGAIKEDKNKPKDFNPEDFEKTMLEMLAQKAMMDFANELKWNEEFDMKTRKTINTYAQMHHDYMSQGEKLEFTAVDGLIIAGLLETVMYYKEKYEEITGSNEKCIYCEQPLSKAVPLYTYATGKKAHLHCHEKANGAF